MVLILDSVNDAAGAYFPRDACRHLLLLHPAATWFEGKEVERRLLGKISPSNVGVSLDTPEDDQIHVYRFVTLDTVEQDRAREDRVVEGRAVGGQGLVPPGSM